MNARATAPHVGIFGKIRTIRFLLLQLSLSSYFSFLLPHFSRQLNREIKKEQSHCDPVIVPHGDGLFNLHSSLDAPFSVLDNEHLS